MSSQRKRPTSHIARDIVPIEQEFLWQARIPVGHITVIAGAPAKGKSTLGYRIAADVDAPTIFVTTEEVATSVWRPRIEAAGMDLAKAAHHSEVKFSKDPSDLDDLAGLVEMYGAKLVVVDPLSNHLRGASIHRDEQIRELFDPYLEWLQARGVALVLQMHVLKSVNARQHPLACVPAGVASVAKAVYLFADDPTLGADPNMRVLACADKFNFGPTPTSMLFEYATSPVKVLSNVTGKRVTRDFGLWVCRGETKVSAKMLLVTLTPETKERKADRAAWFLIEQLKDGPLPRSVLRQSALALEPPIAWRTIERMKKEMSIEEIDDEQDKRRKLWRLPPDSLATLDEADSLDEIQIEKVDVPDAVPEDWKIDGGDDEEEAGS